MTTIGVTLPDTLKAFIDKQVALRGHRDVSEFLQSLLEAEQRRQLGAEVERLLLEAVDGPFVEWTDRDVEDIRWTGQRLRTHL